MSYESSVLGIWSLDPTLPELDSDMEFGDDNIRNIKTALQWQFAGFAGEDAVQVNVKPSELNYLSGVTSNVQTQISGKVATEGLEDTINALNVNATRLGGFFANVYARVDEYTEITNTYDFIVPPTINGVGIATQAWVAAQDYGPEVGEWVTVKNPIATSSGKQGSVQHGISGAPDLVLFRLICLADDATPGWTTGEIVQIGTGTYANSSTTWQADGDYVDVYWDDINIGNSSTGANSNIDPSKWKLELKAIKF